MKVIAAKIMVLGFILRIVPLKKATKTMESGQLLKLVATDPGSVRDVPAWAGKTGAEIIETSESNGEYEFIIKVNKQ